ncbi:hypothetical protein AC1031_019675 [Aphanomyces cochlioides]|nr:hypothetical protein AC1031_019675 [Aphanomyces cochlioides]
MPRVAPQVDDADSVGQIETLDDRLSETERIASLSSIGVVDPEQFDLPLESKTTLDGFLLLDTCKGTSSTLSTLKDCLHVAEFPEDVSRADVNGLGLRSIVAEDLLFFTGLSFLDMSDNQVDIPLHDDAHDKLQAPLGPLGVLPALKELDFQCNALSKLENLTGFDALEWLNLSFNCLVASDVEELAKIPRLRELYLANNWVIHLPPIMDHFTRLETLSLERNNINGTDIFAALAVAPRLKNLNLSHNKITQFPQTQREGSGFPALSYLNLAHNKIAKECDILALVRLRVLEQLVLYGNPLAHAAVQDKTKLIYNPVPNMTDPNVETEREVQLNIVIAYPDTKRRKPTYKNVAIVRVAQAALPTSQEFKARGQRMLKTDPAATIFPPLQVDRRPDDDAKVQEDEPRDGPDATFITGVGLEDTASPMEIVTRPDKFPHVKDQKHTEPAMPSYFLTRSLAPTTEVQQHKLKTAMSSLRYVVRLFFAHMGT